MKKLFFAIAAAAMLAPGAVAASAYLAKDLAAAKAITASGPPWYQALGMLHRTGARSGSPVISRLPPIATTTRSCAFQCA